MSREILPLRLGAGRFLSRHASPTVWTRTLDHWGFALGCCPLQLSVEGSSAGAARCREIFVSACKTDCVDAYTRSLGFCSGLLSYKGACQEKYFPCGSVPGDFCLGMQARLCGRVPSIIGVLLWVAVPFGCVS